MVTVLPDGRIHYPLIGEVMVGGKTLAVLEKELKDKINPFVPNPELSVMINQINSLLIYVIGKVKSPRKICLDHEYQCVAGPGHGRRTRHFCQKEQDQNLS